MISFIVRRLIYMLPILFIVSFIIFLLMWMQPGDVVDSMCGLACPPDQRAALRAQYGLDESFVIQYAKWVHGVFFSPTLEPTFPFLHLHEPDFGYSPTRSMPALHALLGENRWLWTILLVFSSMIISWMVAIPIGVYSATHKYSLADNTFSFLGFIGISLPNFILGLLFIWFIVGVLNLGIHDKFFSIGGILNTEYVGEPITLEVVLNFLWHFAPPVLILAFASTAIVIRYMRSNMLDVLEMAYVKTARAKGLKEHFVIYKHALRNAINPLVSMLGFWIPMMMEGALVIAIVFNLPQLETSFFQAIITRDTMIVMSGLFVFSLILMFGNLISDILLAITNPKIRYE